jgi:hypothetical protein
LCAAFDAKVRTTTLICAKLNYFQNEQRRADWLYDLIRKASDFAQINLAGIVDDSG